MELLLDEIDTAILLVADQQTQLMQAIATS